MLQLLFRRRTAALAVGMACLNLACGGSQGQGPKAASEASSASAEAPASTDAAGEPPAEAAANAPVRSVAEPSNSTAPADAQEIALLHPRGARSWLGVEMEATATREAGVRVVRVLRGSPAEAAGLLGGDVVLSIGERRVDAPAQMGETVSGIRPGTEVGVTLLRAGQQRLLRVHLEGLPDFEDRLRLAFIGQQAPSIDGVVTFRGSAASLTELKGRVVLLEFWASWCGVCRYLAPVLTDWQRSYHPAGLDVVGITSDPPKLGAQAAAEARMDYTLMSDAQARVTRSYLASQVPTVFVIDRQGVIVEVMVGLSSRRLKEVQALLEELIDEPS